MRVPFLIPCALVVLFVSSARAELVTWTGAVSGEWHNRLNWSGNSVPTVNDTVIFPDTTPNGTLDFGARAEVPNLIASHRGGSDDFVFGSGPVGSQKMVLKSRLEGPDQEGAGTMTVNADVLLSSPTGVTPIYSGYTSRFSFLGAVSGEGTGDRNLRINGPSRVDFQGVISDGNSGALKFTVSSGIAGLHAANTYSGGTEVVGQSRLILGAAGVIPDTSALYLSGGSMLETSGFDEIMGSLSALVAAGIDFGTGSSELWFANSSAQTWSGKLPLLNFDIGLDSLRFGTDSSALTASQLASIQLPGYAASLDPAGYVVFTPVPEPGVSCLAVVGILSLASVTRRFARR